jgi:hypothetical protein
MVQSNVARVHSEYARSAEITSSERLAQMRARQTAKIAEIQKALVLSGFKTSSEQAVALGLSPSTDWMVLKATRKHLGLSPKIIRRMLSSAQMPSTVRQILEGYVGDTLLGAYGHSRKQLKLFRSYLGYPTAPYRRAILTPESLSLTDACF